MKMFVACVALSLLTCVGCSSTSAPKAELGDIVHKTVTCADPVQCKLEMRNKCEKGGVIHKISPALHVEYSCNDS